MRTPKTIEELQDIYASSLQTWEHLLQQSTKSGLDRNEKKADEARVEALKGIVEDLHKMADTRELTLALKESLKLQSHYAALLNQHDGGERIGFASPEAWIERLREVGTLQKEVSDPSPEKMCYVVVQEGGSSSELYPGGHDDEEEAEADRVNCSKDGAYRTAPLVAVPESLMDHPEFFPVLDAVLSSLNDLDLVEVPDAEVRMIQVREHRGQYEESMATVAEVPATLEAVAAHFRSKLQGVPPFEDSAITIKLYADGVDERNDWLTHLVCLNGNAIGMASANVEEVEA